MSHLLILWRQLVQMDSHCRPVLRIDIKGFQYQYAFIAYILYIYKLNYIL